MNRQQKQHIENLLKGDGIIISKTNDGFGMAKFGDKTVNDTCFEIAKCLSGLIHVHNEPEANIMFIQLISMVTYIATVDGDAYECLKGALDECRKQRNKVADELLKGLKR